MCHRLLPCVHCGAETSAGAGAAERRAAHHTPRARRVSVRNGLLGLPGLQAHRRLSRSRRAGVTPAANDAIPQEALNWCDVQTRVVSGVPHRAILSTAVEIKPDLIVMGLPMRSALDTIVMGSTTGPVVRRTQYPLLMVPVPANMIESQTLMTSSRALALDSDLYSMVPGRASQANRIGGLASW